MQKSIFVLFCWVASLWQAGGAPLWDVSRLTSTPHGIEWGKIEGRTQEVWYEGEPFAGKPTRVFAWLGRPDGASPTHQVPAMVLVHGGGGRAYRDWAQHWADRGYIAIAMDTAGAGPDGMRHAAAGPDQSDQGKFRNFTEAEAREMWSYHAVSAVLRAHGLLKSLPEVDTTRIGLTGISWGGYLTCLTAGLNPEIQVAVPVYGCGFLGENSYWRDSALAAMTPDSRERWLRLFDPSTTVSQAKCPMLFLNGMHDFAYPPDSHRNTFRLVPSDQRTVAVRVSLDHGHFWTFREVDAFVDSVLRPGEDAPALARIGDMTVEGNTVRAPVLSGGPVVKAMLHYTTMTGVWTARQWKDAPADVESGMLRAELPSERPLSYFFTATDARGLITSSPYEEAAGTKAPAQP
jgi:cephalosporin-C deacetylase-like acetyl esterase